MFVVALAEPDEAVLWQSGKESIKLVASQASNAHPITLEPFLITNALREIKVNIAGEFFTADKQQLLFSEFTAKTLGRQLAIGLARARGDQDIVFSVVDKAQNNFFSGKSSSGGRVFYRDGSLHLIMGETLLPFEGIQDVRKGDVGTLKLARPGSRERVYLSSKITFAQSAGIQFATVNGLIRDDWLILDIERMMQAGIDWYKPNKAIENKTQTEPKTQAEPKTRQTEHSARVQESLLEELARLRQEISELKTRCP